MAIQPIIDGGASLRGVQTAAEAVTATEREFNDGFLRTSLSSIESLLESESIAADMSELYELDEEIMKHKILGTLHELKMHLSASTSGSGVAAVISDVRQLLSQLLYLLAAYLRKAIRTPQKKQPRLYKRKPKQSRRANT